MMAHDAGEHQLLVAARLGVEERRAQAIAAGVGGFDFGALHDVLATALGLLRKRARLLEAFDAQLEQQPVLVHQRGVIEAVVLAVRKRYPVEAVVGEQRVPGVELLVVDEARLAIDEVGERVAQGGIVGVGHCAVPVSCWCCCWVCGAICRAQARNWLRIEISLVPFTVRSAACASSAR
ncbi:hypothetical protein PT2222_90078 [Paraburkholderia tropica]